MSDPISVIATIVMSATGAIDNANLPSAAKASAHAAVESGGDAATSFSVRLDRAVAQLPEPAQQSARTAVDAAYDRMAAMAGHECSCGTVHYGPDAGSGRHRSRR